MVNILATNFIKSECKEQFLAIAAELVIESNKEEGCISYGLFEDIKDKNVLTFIEEWKDLDAIEFHNNTEHFKRLVPKLGECTAKPGDVRLYTKSL